MDSISEITSMCFPLHIRPSPVGFGLSQYRCLIMIPWSQVEEQLLHVDQLPQLPSPAYKNN